MKSYPLLLRKYISDKAKVSSLVEIVLHMNLEYYSLKRQEQVGEFFCAISDFPYFSEKLTSACFSEFQKFTPAHERRIF